MEVTCADLTMQSSHGTAIDHHSVELETKEHQSTTSEPTTSTTQPSEVKEGHAGEHKKEKREAAVKVWCVWALCRAEDHRCVKSRDLTKRCCEVVARRQHKALRCEP